MESVKKSREARGLSQRALAARAALSFRGVQLLEHPGHDPRLSSLDKVAGALGLPRGALVQLIERYLALPPDGVEAASLRSVADGESSWMIHLFDFVDRFRGTKDPNLVSSPPTDLLGLRLRALFASTVDALCREVGIGTPRWSAGIGPLELPWFVSGIENLKATALIESPPEFRTRNIFVLGNFLSRK